MTAHVPPPRVRTLLRSYPREVLQRIAQSLSWLDIPPHIILVYAAEALPGLAAIMEAYPFQPAPVGRKQSKSLENDLGDRGP